MQPSSGAIKPDEGLFRHLDSSTKTIADYNDDAMEEVDEDDEDDDGEWQDVDEDEDEDEDEDDDDDDEEEDDGMRQAAVGPVNPTPMVTTKGKV